ncbi:glycosyltransferase family 2 protein [Croceicoccus ponticola]|uniref:Glycosyltransferase family 2 protein n=1 Tax=Croceicoccus ponticola TaxID=2217664 RepID=A0A437H2F3_9SPHN|nr:glycosyltransferase [Croceicoccus ponticola]RVQ69749.1 glycosyltransferase family 2 protein [Croceicoccus ponticola]
MLDPIGTYDLSFPVAHRSNRSTRFKYVISLLIAIAWTTLSIQLAQPWMKDLGAITHPLFAFWAISFIAFVPGFMNAFLVASLLMDRRPARMAFPHYPGVTLIVAAYNEENAIRATLDSIVKQNYSGAIEALVVNDGSTDATAERVRIGILENGLPPNISIRLLDFAENRGKAAALNSGLAEAKHDLICTIDGDSRLRRDSIRQIVERFLSDPPGTMAVAGAVLVRNSRETLMAGAQEWDYFHGIAAVKRMQSMYDGTLVAQGAFSLYRRDALNAVGGWPETVGEDIVLTWAMLKKGYRIGYAEDAILWTDAPPTFKQFARQRQRWSRGLVEALERHQGLLFKPRLTTLFVWWNMLFLPLDLTFSLVFTPGLILAAFGHYWIAGPMTLAILPLAGLWNIVIFRIQNRMFKDEGLKVRRNRRGLLFYVLVYALVMQPICVWGYICELTRQRKHWGTK